MTIAICEMLNGGKRYLDDDPEVASFEGE